MDSDSVQFVFSRLGSFHHRYRLAHNIPTVPSQVFRVVPGLDVLVGSNFDHWFPVTPELIAVMVCDPSIIGHYSRIIGIIAKYHINCIVQRNKQAIVGISLVPLRSEPG